MKNERVMFEPTIEWMREVYDAFNTMFFKRKLPNEIEFEFVNAKRFGGDARFWKSNMRTKECTMKNHGWYVGSFRIRLSTFYNNITRHEAELLMLHEMIHIYQFSNLPLSEWNGSGIRGCHGYTFTEWIDRIKEMSISDRFFIYDTAFNAETFFKHAFGVYIDPTMEPERILLRAYGMEKCYLDEVPIHESQQKIEEGTGYADYEVVLRPTPDFFHELLAHGNRLKVLEPSWVADEMHHLIRGMLRLYES